MEIPYDIILLLSHWLQNLLASGGLRPLTPNQRLYPWTPLEVLPPDPRYRLTLHVLAICL